VPIDILKKYIIKNTNFKESNIDNDLKKELGASEEYSKTIKSYKYIENSYKNSIKLCNFAVVKAASDLYIKNIDSSSNVLLHFSKEISEKYFTLLKYFCEYEIQKGYPIIPVQIGFLKQHGFSTEKINEFSYIFYKISLIKLRSDVMTCELNFKNMTTLNIKKEYGNFISKEEVEKSKFFYEMLSCFGRLSDNNISFIIEMLIRHYKKTNEKRMLLLLEHKLNMNSNEIGNSIHLVYNFIRRNLPDLLKENYKNQDNYYSKIIFICQNRKLINNLSRISSTLLEKSLSIFQSQENKLAIDKCKKIIEKLLEFNNINLNNLKSNRNNKELSFQLQEISDTLDSLEKINLTNIHSSISFAEKSSHISLDSRLLMEIRHRIVSGDSEYQTSYGNLGTNPQQWLNLFKNKKCENPEAEFRNRMYFVYMLKHFANEIILNKEFLNFINKKLMLESKNWQINKKFVDYLQKRGNKENKHLSPIFRHGQAAHLNNYFRTKNDHETILNKYSKLNIPTYKSIQQENSPFSAIFNSKLSKSELFAMTGNLESTQLVNEKVNFASGSTLFKIQFNPKILSGNINEKNAQNAKRFIELSNNLKLPIPSGISGTLDQSITMAALVGLGINSNNSSNYNYLQTIKLAYIVFMCTPYDCSLHEILYSSKSFNLKYLPGPNIIDYVYPIDPTFKENVKQILIQNNSDLPDNILINSKKFVDDIFNNYRIALELVATCSTAVRTVDVKDLNSELCQLENPETMRHKFLPHQKDRAIIFNPKTKETTQRIPSVIRGAKKETKFTKKASTTLFRPDGNMFLFGDLPFNDKIVFMYNLASLHNKDWKYVFTENAFTDYRWWLGKGEDPDSLEKREKYSSYQIDINILKKQLILNSKNNIEFQCHNELLIGLCKEGLIGLAFVSSGGVDKDLCALHFSRKVLCALILWKMVKLKLNINLPIFTYDPMKEKDDSGFKSHIRPVYLDEINSSLNIAFEKKPPNYDLFVNTLFSKDKISQLTKHNFAKNVILSLDTQFVSKNEALELEKIYQKKLQLVYTQISE
jgi:hypothetical protein